MIELDRATLSRIESGIGNPTIETLQRIADGLGVDIAEFVIVESSPAPKSKVIHALLH